jgi:hypothetical protein
VAVSHFSVPDDGDLDPTNENGCHPVCSFVVNLCKITAAEII